MLSGEKGVHSSRITLAYGNKKMIIWGSLVHSLNLVKYDNGMPKKGSGLSIWDRGVFTLLPDIVEHEHSGIPFS